MPRLKHLALVSLDPERLARFYEQVFEMKVQHRSGGAIYMTDGYITLALLSNKAEGKPNGLNHFGFEVDSQDDIARRIAKFELAAPVQRPADRPYAETRATDPDGNNFDLSTHGFGTVEFAADRKADRRS